MIRIRRKNNNNSLANILFCILIVGALYLSIIEIYCAICIIISILEILILVKEKQNPRVPIIFLCINVSILLFLLIIKNL